MSSTARMAWSPPKGASLSANRREYDRLGFTIHRSVLDESLLAEVRQHVEWLQQKHPEQRPENLNETLAHGDPFWVRLVGDSRLLDIGEEYVGPNIALFQSHYICKPAGDGQAVHWHQVPECPHISVAAVGDCLALRRSQCNSVWLLLGWVWLASGAEGPNGDSLVGRGRQ